MIDENTVPPFTAYRLTPKRQVTAVKLVSVEHRPYGALFRTDRNGTYLAEQMWPTELDALLHVRDWVELRKSTLKAELAKLENTELKTNRRIRELGHERQA